MQSHGADPGPAALGGARHRLRKREATCRVHEDEPQPGFGIVPSRAPAHKAVRLCRGVKFGQIGHQREPVLLEGLLIHAREVVRYPNGLQPFRLTLMGVHPRLFMENHFVVGFRSPNVTAIGERVMSTKCRDVVSQPRKIGRAHV